MSDSAELWQAFKEGDRPAYARIYDLNFARLCHYGYKFTRNTALIEDSIHDLFARMWVSRRKLGEPASVKNYLYKAFRNILLRKLQADGRFDDLDDDYAFRYEPAQDASMVLRENEQALRQKLQFVINGLPARQREIIYLRFYEGMNYEEIADLMAINVNSAYKLLYKALDKLQKVLTLSKTSVIMALVLNFSLLEQKSENIFHQ
ncbi:MAG: sigma-70 family RNA polymerase sigma factor [Mucilaginibacter polytrichastri]|nr:sigma-70 family RNA polymerase sigma factor [Mucilaginibacter polytrichastri]